ncbi:Chemotaxis phosphatase CheX [Mariprofundus aestuarium]|uniref:Chemotaxis phosphatase CheX n=1 Tax=Mariprofundus aestuarium TaxID=1921086 RepID=A0A2K8L2U1_MARES|nr:chemotaxis protein CheX [Mariprofundus aestuarium]ATX78556.1 Chemotaxis phosphatase CheX [Mariprofundus aestuarium]
MHFNEEDINRIITDIWTTILDLEIEYVHDGVTLPKGERSMVGCIQIAGEWQGAVTLFCPDSLVRKATASMFGMTEDEVSEDEMQDALGELTNMTAGNINTLLPQGCCISLPSVAEGIDYKITIPGGKVTCELGFLCEGEPMIAAVVARG